MTHATIRLGSFALSALCVVFGLAGCVGQRPAPVFERSVNIVDDRAETYTVKRYDTLYSIALEHGADWREMATWNGISDPSKLAVGQTLRVKPPQAPVYASNDGAVQVSPISIGPAIEARPLDGTSSAGTPAGAATAPSASGALKTEPQGLKLPYSEQNVALVQRGGAPAPSVATAPAAPAPHPGESPAVPAKAEPAAQVASVSETTEAGGIQWSWPTTGKLTTRFEDGGSKGVQIGGRLGDPILASASGKVTYVGDGVRGYGNLVIVKHNDQYLSVYAHNRKNLVQGGQSVSKGQKIAEMGNGADNKPLLHFEIRRFGKPVDPLEFLPDRTD